MPITVLASEGIFTPEAEQQVFDALTQAFLKHNNLLDNAFMLPNVIGEISTIPSGRSFAGGKPQSIVIVELKVPSFALASQEQKQGFVADATEAVHKATGGKHPKERIFVNMVFTADGLWGIAGRAYTNADLGAAVANVQ